MLIKSDRWTCKVDVLHGFRQAISGIDIIINGNAAPLLHTHIAIMLTVA